MTNLQIHLDTEIPDEQLNDFIGLVQALESQIDTGDSLKEIRIIADDALASTLQSLTGKPFNKGFIIQPALRFHLNRVLHSQVLF